MNNGKHGQGTHCTKIGVDSWPKIPQMPQNLSALFVYPSPKVLNFNEKRLHCVSIVHGIFHLNVYAPGKSVTQYKHYDIPRKQSEKQSWNRFSAKSIKQIRFASYWIAANQKIHNKNPMKPHGPFNMFTLMQVLSRFLSTNLLFIVLGTYISITLIKFLRRMKFERLMIPISIFIANLYSIDPIWRRMF